MTEQQPKKREAKKSFFEVKAPMTSTKISLYAPTAESLHGKVITLDLTRSLRGKNLVLRMRVVPDSEGLAADPISIELVGSYIRRMVRKGTDYVEDSFTVVCKDGSVVIKPFMITRNKVSRAIRRELRNRAREHLTAHATMRTTKELFTELISNKIQKELSLKLKKVYPLALCEIRYFGLAKQKQEFAQIKK